VGKRHDFVGIVLNDERENVLPKIGLIKIQDAETGEERYVDTSEMNLQEWFTKNRNESIARRKSMFIKSRLDSINIQTGQSYIKPLIDFFRLRERRW
jgi:hypothetical protein